MKQNGCMMKRLNKHTNLSLHLYVPIAHLFNSGLTSFDDTNKKFNRRKKSNTSIRSCWSDENVDALQWIDAAQIWLLDLWTNRFGKAFSLKNLLLLSAHMFFFSEFLQQQTYHYISNKNVRTFQLDASRRESIYSKWKQTFFSSK